MGFRADGFKIERDDVKGRGARIGSDQSATGLT